MIFIVENNRWQIVDEKLLFKESPDILSLMNYIDDRIKGPLVKYPVECVCYDCESKIFQVNCVLVRSDSRFGYVKIDNSFSEYIYSKKHILPKTKEVFDNIRLIMIEEDILKRKYDDLFTRSITFDELEESNNQ